MAALEDLHPELLTLILEYVVQNSAEPFPTLNLVNHHFNNVTKHLVKREVKLDYSPQKCTETEALVQQLLADEGMLANIRSLVIQRHRPLWEDPGTPNRGRGDSVEGFEDEEEPAQEPSSPYYESWDPLQQLITTTRNLKTLVWAAEDRIPKLIVEALQANHPTSTLKVLNWTKRFGNLNADDEDELALLACPNLREIRAEIRMGFDGLEIGPVHNAVMEAAFFRILASAPNLEHASVIKLPTPMFSTIFDLEETSLIDQKKTEYDVAPNRSSSLRSLTIDGYGAASQTLDMVEKYVNTTNLTSFKFTRGLPDITFFKESSKKLPNLKHFNINLRFADPDTAEAADKFLSQCNPLESLSLWSWAGQIPLSTILRHGPALQKLELHEREDDGRPRRLLTIEEIQQIRESCPLLQDLTFDLDMDGFSARNIEIYEELHQFPSLRRLQIYFDLGNRHRNSVEDTISHIRILRAQRRQQARDDGLESASLLLQGISTHPITIHEDEEEDSTFNTDTSADVDDDVDAEGEHESEDQDQDQDDLEDELQDLIEEEAEFYGPSDFEEMLSHFHSIWLSMFGPSPPSHKQLDIKIGEWERKIPANGFAGWLLHEEQNKTFWQIRSAERDDKKGCVSIKKYGGRSYELHWDVEHRKPAMFVKCFPRDDEEEMFQDAVQHEAENFQDALEDGVDPRDGVDPHVGDGDDSEHEMS